MRPSAGRSSASSRSRPSSEALRSLPSIEVLTPRSHRQRRVPRRASREDAPASTVRAPFETARTFDVVVYLEHVGAPNDVATTNINAVIRLSYTARPYSPRSSAHGMTWPAFYDRTRLRCVPSLWPSRGRFLDPPDHLRRSRRMLRAGRRPALNLSWHRHSCAPRPSRVVPRQAAPDGPALSTEHRSGGLNDARLDATRQTNAETSR
jgi:hypothetical protein